MKYLSSVLRVEPSGPDELKVRDDEVHEQMSLDFLIQNLITEKIFENYIVRPERFSLETSGVPEISNDNQLKAKRGQLTSALIRDGLRMTVPTQCRVFYQQSSFNNRRYLGEFVAARSLNYKPFYDRITKCITLRNAKIGGVSLASPYGSL